MVLFVKSDLTISSAAYVVERGGIERVTCQVTASPKVVTPASSLTTSPSTVVAPAPPTKPPTTPPLTVAPMNSPTGSNSDELSPCACVYGCSRGGVHYSCDSGSITFYSSNIFFQDENLEIDALSLIEMFGYSY